MTGNQKYKIGDYVIFDISSSDEPQLFIKGVICKYDSSKELYSIRLKKKLHGFEVENVPENKIKFDRDKSIDNILNEKI